MRVRDAAPGEVVALRHRVLRAGRPRESAVWDGDDTARHFVLEDPAIEAVVSLFRRGADWQLRGMAVALERQGQGLGRALLQGIWGRVPGTIWCNARVSAVGFYRANGWEELGEAFDIVGVGPHVRMVWERAPGATTPR